MLTVLGQALFQEAEDLLETWKHPDPYRAPTAPGGEWNPLGDLLHRSMLMSNLGSKFERNLPAPILDRMFSPSSFSSTN